MTDPMTLPHRIEAAEGADRALDYDIAHLTGDHFRNGGKAPTYTASIDAALTLVPEGCEWIVEAYTSNGVKAAHVRASAWVPGAPRCFAATPALALCAAALRAKESDDG